MMVQNGGVFNLGNNPVGLMAKFSHSQLNAMAAQKGGRELVSPNSGVLARIALAYDANNGITEPVTLIVDKFQIITGSGTVTTIDPSNVKFGTLAIN
jgi:hypothetical protein